ncbi:glycosyltransferase family 2 protein [Hirschia maritima]|uniref:glycosyltransferase family 2 protein n=1 Tax=Hirschia maritima TaxID=1121961 RepID=UPI00037BF733|nr:glycosyltransferase family 2 protein [Hirschia maritima]
MTKEVLQNTFKNDMIVAAVLPCYKSKDQVLDVIERFGDEIDLIVCVDDKCPVETGLYIQKYSKDPRVHVIFQKENGGVGAATLSGMQYASLQNADIVVKVDSDGQMDPKLIPALIQPIIAGQADFTKGNRFFNPEDVSEMPVLRLVGNAGLSFLTKLSSGYWDIFDPTNGFLAIHTSILRRLNAKKLSKRFFFESDLLFRAGLVRARIQDMPMRAIYADEESNLKIGKVLFEFGGLHIVNFFKRIFYNYFLRDFSAASLYLIFGLLSILIGSILGISYFGISLTTGVAATSGQVMMSALPLFMGGQFLIAFLTYDIGNKPTVTLWKSLVEIDKNTDPKDIFGQEAGSKESALDADQPKVVGQDDGK